MDHRERSYYPSYVKQNHKNMTIEIELDAIESYPAEYSVCPDCNGKGKYVNPAIDSHGLTAEDFAADPDFEDGYHSGRYDIRCRSCNGMRVILVPKTDEGKAAIQECIDEDRAYRAEIAAERRMGA